MNVPTEDGDYSEDKEYSNILDPMASQTRSQLSLLDDLITALLTKNTKKPLKKTLAIVPAPATSTALAIVSVTRPPSELLLVETVSTGDNTKPSLSAFAGITTLFENPGETVPAPQEWHK